MVQNSVINILGDLNVRNGRFFTPTTPFASLAAVINIHGDLTLECPDVAAKTCYNTSTDTSFSFIGYSNSSRSIDPIGSAYSTQEQFTGTPQQGNQTACYGP